MVRLLREGRKDDHTGDQHDTFRIEAWLYRTDGGDAPARYLSPMLKPREAAHARVEGLSLGVLG